MTVEFARFDCGKNRLPTALEDQSSTQSRLRPERPRLTRPNIPARSCRTLRKDENPGTPRHKNLESPVEEEKDCVDKIVSSTSNIQLSSSNLAHLKHVKPPKLCICICPPGPHSEQDCGQAEQWQGCSLSPLQAFPRVDRSARQ